ncbi:hypothetical protein IV73_GL000437 [Weissella kandleri]|uniref:Methyltransferase domain-containing protein n=2 Tax=Weissella kandleri TaxID=1616 RepID=A0A0R2JD80_9LACO|nr:hypothetical protein IV73_GL000437 [Weissella kandleri]
MDKKMKKIDKGRQFLQNNLALFKCGVCDQPYAKIEDTSLVCPLGHQLDLNKKGSMVFLKHAVNTEYDDAMLAARRRILTAGLFDGIIQAVNQSLPATPQTILDVGTGEGTPLARLLAQRSSQTPDIAVGFDISKAGVQLATQLDTDAFFAVADLAQLPFNDQVFDAIIEFFSPSAYHEFQRVLKPQGTLVKVVPNAGYLQELREKLYLPDSKNYTYDNQAVVERFIQQYPEANKQIVQYQWAIPQALWVDLLHMTPLHWGARAEMQVAAEQQPLPTVTVDVTILQV